jgi:predicted secreted protein
VSLVTNEFVRPKTKLAGAPGREVWQFKALHSGETVIELKYVRPWEKGVEPAQKTNIVVVVTDPKQGK